MQLFEPISIGSLRLRNRIVRSATAERLTHPDTGDPLPALADMYRALAEGGVGLIITGHAYVHRRGRCHPEMAAIDDDARIAAWRRTVAPAQAAGAKVMMQINHSGASADPRANPHPLSPSGVATNPEARPEAMTEEQVREAIAAFAAAARRAREAGLDGVQVHGAHGYLVSQFLTPATNRRDDAWGGSEERRQAFLREVLAAVRRAVGDDYPVWIKLGVAGEQAHGLDAAMGARAATACRDAGVDCIEVSHALGIPESLSRRGEARFLPLAHAVREAVGSELPLALVNWLRSRQVMDEVLAAGEVQLISLCRPLIAEPDLPRKLRDGAAVRAACVSCDRCWPEHPGEGVSCHNEKVQEALRCAS